MSVMLLCPDKFVLNIYHTKNKNLAPLTVYFAFQTLKPGYCPALCLPTLLNLQHFNSSESATVSDFSPHIIFAVS